MTKFHPERYVPEVKVWKIPRQDLKYIKILAAQSSIKPSRHVLKADGSFYRLVWEDGQPLDGCTNYDLHCIHGMPCNWTCRLCPIGQRIFPLQQRKADQKDLYGYSAACRGDSLGDESRRS